MPQPPTVESLLEGNWNEILGQVCPCLCVVKLLAHFRQQHCLNFFGVQITGWELAQSGSWTSIRPLNLTTF